MQTCKGGGDNKKSYLAMIPGRHINDQGGMVTLRVKQCPACLASDQQLFNWT